MPIIEQSVRRLVYHHAGGRRTSITVGLRYFFIASVLGGPGVLLYHRLQSPAELKISCDRGTGRCQVTHYRGGGDRSFSMLQLPYLIVDRPTKRKAALAVQVSPMRGKGDTYRVNYWGGEVSSPDDVARLERGVARLRAFPGGTEATITVKVPNGDGGLRWWLPPLGALIALWQLLIIRRSFRRSEIVVDADARTITVTHRRYLWPARVESTPFEGVTQVFLRRQVADLNPRYRHTTVALERGPGPRMVLVESYWAKQEEAEAEGFARELAQRLSVPVVEG